MPYRRTEAVVRRMAEREQSILDAAAAIAGETGMSAVQIATVAKRAGIAAGTVYRYFPSKTALVSALVGQLTRAEIEAMTAAGDAAPGPLSALAAAIACFAARVLLAPKLAWGLSGEPVEAEIEAVRLDLRRALVAAFGRRIKTAIEGGHLPDQDVRRASAALTGALLEGLVGPLTPAPGEDAGARRAAVQELTLLSLRALGVVDARARGLVAQVALP